MTDETDMQPLVDDYRERIATEGALVPVTAAGARLVEFDPSDSTEDFGIVLAPAADDEAFWRLVTYDVEHRSAAYSFPVPVDLTEVKRSHDGWTRYGTAVLSWAQANVQPPVWGWYGGQGSDDEVDVVALAEGAEGAFHGALIRLVPVVAGQVDSLDRPHIRIRYATLGVHTHCSVWSVERGGPDVAHGRNGTLVFRNAEFAAIRALIELGLDTTDHAMGRSAEVEFVEDPKQAGGTAGSVTRALYETEGSE